MKIQRRFSKKKIVDNAREHIEGFHNVVERIEAQVEQLEYIGETDMGHLTLQLAGRFHGATARLRSLVQVLRMAESEAKFQLTNQPPETKYEYNRARKRSIR